jgi:glycosyltransferase involved in cell wall biosynthesis
LYLEPNNRKMKVLIIAPYPPGKAPNQRFRFEQYLPAFKKAGIAIDYRQFWSDKVWNIFYQKGFFFTKLFGLFGGIGRRFALLLTVKNYDFIFIHRECLPIGPPVIEFIIVRVFKKKIIYDFDDAIWLPNNSEANRFVARWFKFHSKVKAISKISYKVTAGNHFLAKYAKEVNPRVEVIPTTIDTDNYHNQLKNHDANNPLIIGWTGTHSTLIQISQIEEQLGELQKEIPFEFMLICNADPCFTKVKYRYHQWYADTEISDLLKFDIGVMPLRNTDWERGKCGFKALQYMALGIPCVASNVGANSNILTHEVNGYLISPEKPEDWKLCLRQLLLDVKKRKSIGAAGRETVLNHFSVKSNTNKYLRLFE